MPELVLASTSPWRAQILKDAGLSFRTRSPGIDETVFADADPEARAIAIARAKADAVDRVEPVGVSDRRWILAADQVVHDPESGAIFGKPPNATEHARRLLAMRGRAHALVTGYAIGPGGEAGFTTGQVTTRIHVRADVTEDEVHAYVATGEGSGCAGGYAAEARGGFLIERVEGDWNNVIGLPLYSVWSVLRANGWRFDG